MRLNLLFKREAFESIFINTVQRYLKSQLSWNGKIYIGNESSKKKYFLFNSYLNIIFPSNISESTLKLLVEEYLYDQSILKSILRSIYLKLSILKITRNFLSSRKLFFINYEKRFDDFVFLGGNNTIKILDFKNKECIVLKKYGFSSIFFENGLKTRILYSNIIKNTLTKYNNNEHWYKELFLKGIPLDRQKNDFYSEEAFNIAKEKMKLIYKFSKRDHKFKPYLNNLSKSINKEINNLNKNYKDKFRSSLFKLVFLIRRNFILQNQNQPDLQLAISHGDFNKGNIVFSKSDNNICIIDWEYSYERVIWYDSFYLELNACNPRGISKRINNLKKYNNNDFQKLFWVENSMKYTLERDFYINLFILESLLNRLLQCNVSPDLKKDKGLYIFLNELKKIF